MKLTFCKILLLAVLIMGAAQPAFAHKIRVFAYSEGDSIVTESAFSRGKPAINANITVTDAVSGKTYLSGKTDTKGAFSFPIPEEARQNRADLLIVVNAGEGHRGEWPLAASEYLGEVSSSGPESATMFAPSPSPSVDAAPTTPATAVLDEAALERIVERAVDKKLAPVKKLLLETENSDPGLADIMGGIGYIFGLFGFAALVISRKRQQ